MQDNKIECHDGEFIESSKEEILERMSTMEELDYLLSDNAFKG